MSDGNTYLTAEGLVKLQSELASLKGSKRKEIAQRIQDAKELGDLSENAEYVEAKNEQAFAEGRIAEIENLLKNVTVIDERKSRKGVVNIGSKVTLKNTEHTRVYHLVGSNEADPAAGKISNESPLGRAFLGKKVGESVSIEVPKGTITFEILKID